VDFKGGILDGKSKARYELLGRPSNGDVASGGQGEVWLARKLDTRAAEVAIKLLGQ
jgi:hypothetical protein